MLRLGELSTSSMISRVVGHVAMVSCAAPSYLTAHRTPTSLEDLSGHRGVTYSPAAVAAGSTGTWWTVA